MCSSATRSLLSTIFSTAVTSAASVGLDLPGFTDTSCPAAATATDVPDMALTAPARVCWEAGEKLETLSHLNQEAYDSLVLWASVVRFASYSP